MLGTVSRNYSESGPLPLCFMPFLYLLRYLDAVFPHHQAALCQHPLPLFPMERGPPFSALNPQLCHYEVQLAVEFLRAFDFQASPLCLLCSDMREVECFA